MLLFCINVRNGNRAGALALMSVSDFRDRKKCCDRKSGETEYSITVTEITKTYGDFGNATLSLSPTLNYEMETYLSVFRPFVMSRKKEDHGFFFVTSTGNSLVDGGKLSHSLSRHVEKAGLGHINSNTLRKSATTATR